MSIRHTYKAVTAVSQNPDVIKEITDDFRVIFTPLHGAGNVPVREVLKAVGFEQVRVVAEQELPDPQFSTVKSPNPEEREAFTLSNRTSEGLGCRYHYRNRSGCRPHGCCCQGSEWRICRANR